MGKVLNFRPGNEIAVFCSGTRVRSSTRWPWNWPLKKIKECVTVGVGCWDCAERVMQTISFLVLHPLQQRLLSSVTSHEPPHLSSLQSLCLHPVPVLSLSFIAEPVPAFQSSASRLQTEGRRPCPNMRGWEGGLGSCGLEGRLIAHLPR